ncbi:transketolase [Methylobacterium phyllosphaerae]|uniref:Transketolase n=1 Tax=Methylobacterium phyllosphaerae TaxID=418223 RepID=A0AAE8HTJ9_9HYPH|nr:transketolase [Methylobacterium phyllosphaerae]APT31730.1 transketolase [Methylobacterium phyllosphaerae]SFH14674.1 transketolase [Methylobacterium phyllosphaerae]
MPDTPDALLTARMADAIRFLALDAIERVGDGHPGAPLGCAEIAVALFTRHLRCNPADPVWPDRDRFVLSNGHGSMLLYAALHLAGYEGLPMEQIRRFRELGAHTHGHPEIAPELGIEATTGPLGQGIANAVGMAVAEARLAATFGSDLVDHRTYALVGDGCLQEGIAHEVISLAGHLRLGKLTFLWDDNRITDDGATDLSISEDVRARFRAADWQVIDADGHDVVAVSAAIRLAQGDPRPTLIACRTVIGRGLPRLEGQRGAHGGRVLASDCAEARAARGWDHPPFTVPDDVAAAWQAGVSGRNRDGYTTWTRRRDALPAEVRAEFDRVSDARLPEGWHAPLRGLRDRFAEAGAARPSIEVSAEIVAAVSDGMPELFSGAPDLEGPTKHKGALHAFTAQDRSGRYLHYGIREHAMGAMMNGIAAHRGLVPVGATYLVFSDYMRPSLRMAALMNLPVITVYSHDSIAIGRNGPTHQPVEYLASLRAIPNMLVLRPADAVETAECWEMALANRTGPTSLVCSRQALPALRGPGIEENRSARGAYVLAEASGPRRVTLIGTGSEVALALTARAMLQAEGVPTAVVSMPSWEAFAAQDAAYRASVIPRDTVRVAVEAALRFGWDRWIGEDGGFVGMTGFGASGAPEDLFRHFGITAEAVAETARARLR